MDKDKATGNDLLELGIFKTYDIRECSCWENYKSRAEEEEWMRKLGNPNPRGVGKCDCQNPTLEDRKPVNIKEILIERIALMMITNTMPKYLFNVRLVCFSKNGTVVIDDINQVRPIGIQSIIVKIIEKTWKEIIEIEMPELLQTERYQAGFTKGRETTDHICTMIQRIAIGK